MPQICWHCNEHLNIPAEIQDRILTLTNLNTIFNYAVLCKYTFHHVFTYGIYSYYEIPELLNVSIPVTFARNQCLTQIKEMNEINIYCKSLIELDNSNKHTCKLVIKRFVEKYNRNLIICLNVLDKLYEMIKNTGRYDYEILWRTFHYLKNIYVMDKNPNLDKLIEWRDNLYRNNIVIPTIIKQKHCHTAKYMNKYIFRNGWEFDPASKYYTLKNAGLDTFYLLSTRHILSSHHGITETILHKAIRNNNVGAIKYLLENPHIDINGQYSRTSHTPLHLAIIHKNIEIIDILLNDSRIDITVRHLSQHTAFCTLLCQTNIECFLPRIIKKFKKHKDFDINVILHVPHILDCVITSSNTYQQMFITEILQDPSLNITKYSEMAFEYLNKMIRNPEEYYGKGCAEKIRDIINDEIIRRYSIPKCIAYYCLIPNDSNKFVFALTTHLFFGCISSWLTYKICIKMHIHPILTFCSGYVPYTSFLIFLFQINKYYFKTYFH